MIYAQLLDQTLNATKIQELTLEFANIDQVWQYRGDDRRINNLIESVKNLLSSKERAQNKRLILQTVGVCGVASLLAIGAVFILVKRNNK